MSSLQNLRRPPKSWHRKKRVGRGQGSGLGKTAGRGGKGQKARSGNMRFEGFEGGQSPLQRRLPKFGFNSPNRLSFGIINLSRLEELKAGSVVDSEVLREKGWIKGKIDGLRILGGGKLSKKLTVKAHHFSEAAKSAIEAVGGVAELLQRVVHRPESAAKAHSGKGVPQARKA